MNLKSISLLSFGLLLLLSSFTIPPEKCALTVSVDNLQNSTGVVQFALYNKDGTIPDEKYQNYFMIGTAKIVNGLATYTFTGLDQGKYAVNILHDENEDGQIEKGFILPIEGIGFSKFSSIGFSNRPNFKKASFELRGTASITVKVIYM
jgi:uncharacterized protein (DUF2141 family)